MRSDYMDGWTYEARYSGGSNLAGSVSLARLCWESVLDGRIGWPWTMEFARGYVDAVLARFGL